jgi:protoporphyrinogen/coproporphyrinogen III oxidase
MTDLDVAVVGAGAAGLAAAHFLRKAGRSVHVFEADDRIGGRMRTLRRDGYLIDEGAEMISTRGYDTTWQLIRELEVPDAEIPRVTSSLAMWRGGRPRRHVAHPLGLLTGAGLSPRARLDMLRYSAALRPGPAFDPDRPENTPLGDITMAELAGRYDTELRDYMFQPMAEAFFGWDLRRSAAAPFAAHMRAAGTALNWRTYRGGMDELPRRLADRLDVTTGTPVHEVISGPTSAQLSAGSSVLTARTVVLAVPAPAALAVHANAPEHDRRFLSACTFVPRLRVSCLLDGPIQFPAEAPLYIALLPAAERSDLITINLEHNKCPGRAPAGRGLVTMLTSPAASRALIGASDDEITRRCIQQAERYLPGLRAETRAVFVHRFMHGMPEVPPAALRLRPQFLRRPVSSVEYAGDWLMLRPCSEGAFRSAAVAAERISQAADASQATGASTAGASGASGTSGAGRADG